MLSSHLIFQLIKPLTSVACVPAQTLLPSLEVTQYERNTIMGFMEKLPIRFSLFLNSCLVNLVHFFFCTVKYVFKNTSKYIIDSYRLSKTSLRLRHTLRRQLYRIMFNKAPEMVLVPIGC
jgi:hypothetical protein